MDTTPTLPKEVLIASALKRLETEPLAPGWQRYPAPEHAEWLIPPASVSKVGIAVLEYMDKHHVQPVVQAPPVAPAPPVPPPVPPSVVSSTPAAPGQINPPLPSVVESVRAAVAMDVAPLGPPVPPVELAPPVVQALPVAPKEPLSVSEEIRRDCIARGLWAPSSGKPPSDANLKLCLERGITWKALQAEQKAAADAERAAKLAAKSAPPTPPAIASAPPVPSSTPERYLSPGWEQHPAAPDAEMGGFPIHVRAKPLVGWRYQSDEKTAAMVETVPETRKAPVPPVVQASAPTPSSAELPPLNTHCVLCGTDHPTHHACTPARAPVRVESAPVESAQGYRDGRGFTLLVNCHRTTGRVTPFARVFAESMELLMRKSIPQERAPDIIGCHDYRMIPYGRGVPEYHDVLREYLAGEHGLDSEDYLAVDATTAEGRDALSLLESLAGEVIRGF